MKSQDIKNIIKKLPDTPGVYVFKCGLKIIYIGKATSLRDRVRSYFTRVVDFGIAPKAHGKADAKIHYRVHPDIVTTRSPLISKMLGQFDAIEHIKTDSVLEALVLEAHLIKKYQPEANIKEKDNRSFNFVVITKEDFPRVLVMRGRELLLSGISKKESDKLGFEIAYSFGPFPSGGQLKEAMKIVRKMFPFRDKCVPARALAKDSIQPGKPCFNRQIGLCPGVCTGEITKEEYVERIKNIILFFEGNKKRLIKNLEKQMKDFAKNREFEKAQAAKKTLFTLAHIQDISLIKEERTFPTAETFRIESYDIAHLSGTNVVGVMTVVEDGEAKKSDYRKFKIRAADETFSRVLGKNPQTTRKTSVGSTNARFINDTKALSEVLSRRLGHIEWRMPDLIVVDGGVAQKRAMEKILRENKVQIPVVSVVKDEYHRPKQILGEKKWLVHEREILLSNAEAHRFAIGFHKQLRNKLP